MTYCFDTSVIIDLLRADPVVVRFVADHQHDALITSSVCAFELFCGIYRLPGEAKQEKARLQVREALGSFSEVQTFDSVQAETAGRIWADLSSRGVRIDDIDVLIAAAALSAGATLITRNARHFSRVSGLTVLPL